MKQRQQSTWQLYAGLAITAIFLYLIFSQVDVGRLWETLLTVSPGLIIISLFVLSADFALRICRWWLMLRVLEPGLSYRNCVWPFLVSISINNLVPFRAGDLVRVAGFRTHLRSSTASRVGTLLIERLLDLLVLLMFFFGGLYLVGFESVPRSFVVASLWLISITVLVVLVLLLFHSNIQRLVEGFLSVRLLSKWQHTGKLKLWSNQLFDSLAMLQSTSFTFQLVAISVLAWALEGCVFAIVALSLENPVPQAGAWFALASGTLATLIPSSPGYVGTFDYFTIKAVLASGADQEAATAYALLVHMVLWLPLTLAGAAYFVRPKGRAMWHTLNTGKKSRQENE